MRLRSQVSHCEASTRSPAPIVYSSRSQHRRAVTARVQAPSSNGVPQTNGNGAVNSTAAQNGTSTPPGLYWELITHHDVELGTRAKSASDASMLRRKGHLKEQDPLIDYIIKMHETHTCEEAMHKMEKWMAEHKQEPRRSRLKRLVPGIGSIFTPLRLVEAFKEYDAFFSLSRRKYVPPNFAEIRHCVNIAQVHASAEHIKLVTFDADGTLYADGHHIEQDSQMIDHMISLMRSNVHVGIVTAAGYPGDAAKFEQRIAGLLQAFQRRHLPPSVTDRFHLMGGECNYLLRVRPEDVRLDFVPEPEWKTPTMLGWCEEEIQKMLDEAQTILLEGAARLRVPVQLIRKTRAVGIVPLAPTIYEVLEELALTAQNQLMSAVPFCAFNGGNDVFVDVGNKSCGLEALMNHLQVHPHEVLHVGDRFTQSGNDSATREVCSILWVANPEETSFFIKMLLQDIRMHRFSPYIE